MLVTSSRIWTQITDLISYDDDGFIVYLYLSEDSEDIGSMALNDYQSSSNDHRGKKLTTTQCR